MITLVQLGPCTLPEAHEGYCNPQAISVMIEADGKGNYADLNLEPAKARALGIDLISVSSKALTSAAPTVVESGDRWQGRALPSADEVRTPLDGAGGFVVPLAFIAKEGRDLLVDWHVSTPEEIENHADALRRLAVALRDTKAAEVARRYAALGKPQA